MSKKYEDKFTKKRLRSSFLTMLISTSLVLFVLGLLGLLLLTSEKLSVYVKENIGFSVYLKNNAKEIDIMKLQKQLDAYTFVKTTKYISRKDAIEILKKDLGAEEDFESFLEGDVPLPQSIDVTIHAKYANADSLAWIESKIIKNKIVNEFDYQKHLVHIINKNVKQIGLYLLFVSGLLFLISFSLINNTIRLSVFSKRFLIRTMQLVGATRNYIRWPFIKTAIVQGLISSVLALIGLVYLLYVLGKRWPDLYGIQDIQLYIELFIFVILLGIFISVISTFFAVSKYLRIKVDDLYRY